MEEAGTPGGSLKTWRTLRSYLALHCIYVGIVYTSYALMSFSGLNALQPLKKNSTPMNVQYQ